MALGLQDKETAKNIKDSRLYGLRAKYEYRSEEDKTTYSFNLKVEPCTPQYFPVISKTINIDKDLYCLSEDQPTLPENKQNLEVIGRPDSKGQGKIVITMERCVVDCKQKEEIDMILSTSNIAVYTLNYGIDLKNRNMPFKKNLFGNFVSADSRFTKLLDFFMKVVPVNSDFGYIGANMVTQQFVIQDEVSESISSEFGQIIFRTQIQMSSKTEVYERNYKKIFSFISELGGYLKAMMILAFIYQPFLKRLYFLDLINKLYRVDQNRSLSHVNIDQQQERRLASNLKMRDGIAFKEKDTEFRDAIEKQSNNDNDVKDSELKDPLNNSFSRGLNESESDIEDEQDKRKNMSYDWLDWTTVICPCMKRKKHRLLDKVHSN